MNPLVTEVGAKLLVLKGSTTSQDDRDGGQLWHVRQGVSHVPFKTQLLKHLTLYLSSPG